jgi:hypothetical protein
MSRKFTPAGALSALVMLASLVALPRSVAANTVFSQPPVSGELAFASDGTAGQHLADDITLGANETIASVRFWGAYNGAPPATSDFRVRFFNDLAGVPAANPFADHTINGLVPLATSFTAPSYGTVYEFLATLTIPTPLTAGTPYYLSIVHTSLGPDWYWAGANGLGVYARTSEGASWTSFPIHNNRAFELNNAAPNAVPLPTAAWAGLALIGGLALHRATRNHLAPL